MERGLLSALAARDGAEVARLLDAGVDPDAETPGGRSALDVAAGLAWSRPDLMVTLLDAGARPTPHAAAVVASFGDGDPWLPLLRRLVRGGLDHAALGRALHAACRCGHHGLGAIELLLEAGADPNLYLGGETSLMVYLRAPLDAVGAETLRAVARRAAPRSDFTSIASILAGVVRASAVGLRPSPLPAAWLEGLQQLLSHGADVSARDLDGLTAAEIAVEGGLPEGVVRHLRSRPGGYGAS